jgi:hypothetical protein
MSNAGVDGYGAEVPPACIPAEAAVEEVPADPVDDTHATRAQRVLDWVAKGRQDAGRIAEDLAMALLMSPSEKRFHEAAKLVLNDQELRIPRALELAVRLLGPSPRKSKSKKPAPR